MAVPKARLRIRVPFGGGFAIGSGKADILEAVADTGSISAAARRMKMSYRRAWLLIDTMNRCFREPVVDAAKGGKGGGGAEITAFGLRVLKEFRDIEGVAMRSVNAAMPRFAKLLKNAPPRGKLH